MKKIWRDVLILSAAAVFISLTVFLLIKLTPRPPVEQMELARVSLSNAVKSRADTYSRKLYNEAKTNYDSAMANWERQNTRFIFFRKYDRVEMFAKISASKASEASESSIANSSSLKVKIRQKISTLENLVVDIDNLFTTYPLPAETRNRISKGKLLLKEADVAYDKGDYLQANRKISDSEYLLVSSNDSATENLKNYFKSFPVWQSWTEKAIRESKKNGNYSIIIDKFSRKFMVYHGGVLKMEFDAELGKNWVGDKRMKGDNATPEGMYRITKKFDSRSTKYYKALLLDYPNAEDLAKFKSEKNKGSIPAWAKIGGLIEIHGNGGKGIDWTEGCIALTDKEMDSVFRIAAVGTPVTIVGSTVDLATIMKK
ncbi:MAG TPA: L,D-transpeptidase family protein [Bacteroidales bacterium]|nr:L,D-transpeptidase family protein [Bacteroidales bacterium]